MIALLASIAALAAVAQDVPRDVRVAASRSAAIAGTVVTDDAQPRPVRHARVVLTGPESNGGLTAVTDDAGRFAFEGLAAGRFGVTASKDGWIPSSFGTKKPLGPGMTMALADGERIDVTIRLWRGAVISGTVLDHTGQPAAGTTVRAMRYTVQNGERRLTSGRASATTDDRGAYRLYGLAPGDYVVAATSRPDFFGAGGRELYLTTDLDVRDALASAPAAAAPAPRAISLALTFYPGTTVAAQAAVVAMQAGGERDDVDITLQVVPTARVEGSVAGGAGGTLPGGLEVSLVASGQIAVPGAPVDGYRRTGVAPDGTFAFADVSPGQYTVLARSTIGGQILWASADVSVDGDDVSGVSLALAPGMTVAGQVRFDGVALTPPDPATVRVTLEPVPDGATVTQTPGTAKADANGRFTLAGVTPGRYRLTAFVPGDARWRLRAAVVDGADTLDVPFTVRPNQNVTGAAIVFSDRMAQISGTLRTAADAGADYSVVLFAADPALWTAHSRRIQTGRPSADGAFVFRRLPPGEYRLAAVVNGSDGDARDPAFLRRLLPASVRIVLGDGEERVQNLTIPRSQH
jgi:protocatechuate 3,4-dioxygenase beta subunit